MLSSGLVCWVLAQDWTCFLPRNIRSLHISDKWRDRKSNYLQGEYWSGQQWGCHWKGLWRCGSQERPRPWSGQILPALTSQPWQPESQHQIMRSICISINSQLPKGSKLSRGEICAANFTPPAHGLHMVQAWVVIFVLKIWLQSKNTLNKLVSPFFEENMVKREEKYRSSRQWCRNIWNIWSFL